MAGIDTKEEKFVKQLNFTSAHLAADWRVFKSQFSIFCVAKKFGEMSEEVKIANLLVLMGPDSVPIYEQFVFEEAVATRKKTLKNVLTMFDNHFEPVKNVIFERMKFNSMKQGDMPIHQFITQLQTQANNCEYGTMKDDLVRDRIVVGVTDVKLRDYLIDIDDLDLQKCITKAKQYISHHQESARMAGDNIDIIRTKTGPVGAVAPGKSQQGVVAPGPKLPQWRTQSFGGNRKNCAWCNRQPHSREVCPARASRCNRCKMVGHWAASAMCKGKQSKKSGITEIDEDLEGLFLDSESD